MRPLSVAILGCGPAGLLAAHACQINGAEFVIYSKKRKSPLFGAQYLHEPINGITGIPVTVDYVLNGHPDDYREKVYVNAPGSTAKTAITVSPEELEGEHQAWDIRDAYHRLWNRYSDRIQHIEILPGVCPADIDKELRGHDLVFSTVPRVLFMQEGDQYAFQNVWAVGDAPDLGSFAPFRPAQDNIVICDGTEDVSWYRLSRVFGHTTIEWPGGKKPPIEGVSSVTKPISYTQAKPLPSNWHMLGRYGKWEKGILSTHAFNDALKITEQAGG